MGYDITFHPIKSEEITHFLFDVIENPELVPTRIDELCKDDENRQQFLGEIYRCLLELFQNKESQHVQSHDISYYGATISSFLHPYWYVCNEHLGKLIKAGLLKMIFLHH